MPGSLIVWERLADNTDAAVSTQAASKLWRGLTTNPPDSPYFLLPGLFESNCRRVFRVSSEGCGGVSQLLREPPSSRKKLYHLLGGATPERHVPVYA